MKTKFDFLLGLKEETISDKELNQNHRIKIEMQANSLYVEISGSQPDTKELEVENAKQEDLKTIKHAVEYLLDLQKRLAQRVEQKSASSPKLSTKPPRLLDTQPAVSSSSQSASSSSSSTSSTSTSQSQEVTQQGLASTPPQSSLDVRPRRVVEFAVDTDPKPIKPIDFTRRSKSRAQLFKDKRSQVFQKARDKGQGQQVLLIAALETREIKLQKRNRTAEAKPKSPLSESATPSKIKEEKQSADAAAATSSAVSDAVLERKSRFTFLSSEESAAIRSSTASTSLSSSSSTSDYTKPVVLAGELPTVPKQKSPEKKGRDR